MNVGTIYTLYGRRAGAEMFFERTVLGLAEAFADLTLTVFCNDEAAACLPHNNSRILPRPHPMLNDQFRKAFWLEYLSKTAIAREKIDLFWIPSGANSFPGPWPVPSVVTFLDLGEYFVKHKYDWKRTFYRKHICVPRSLRRAAALAAISQSTATDLARLFNPQVPCHVVYPGPSPRTPEHGTLAQHEAAIIDKLDRIVFCPGRTDYNGKGLDVLLRAYATFRAKTPDPPSLILVGPEGQRHASLLADIDALNLRNAVHYLGRVSDAAVNALYAKSAMVVCSSRYEGFGFPVLEALQHRVPVICSDSASLPEIAGDAALYFPPGDADALADRMFTLYNDHATRQALLAAAQDRLALFTWPHSCAKLRAVFDTVAGRP